jgi:hypothetical protein
VLARDCVTILPQSNEPRGNGPMASVSGIVKQIKKERDRVERELSGLNAALSAFVGAYKGAKPTGKQRTMSAAGRRRISLAQKARWAKQKAKPRRKMSAAGRRRIAAAQRARWAKVRAQQKKAA